MTTTKFAALAIVLVATAAVATYDATAATATYDEVTPETIVDEDQSVETVLASHEYPGYRSAKGKLCRSCRLKGKKLRCKCKQTVQATKRSWSSIALGHCVYNANGFLTKGTTKKGLKACTELELKGADLTATCPQQRGGGKETTTLSLRNIVKIKDGELHCPKDGPISTRGQQERARHAPAPPPLTAEEKLQKDLTDASTGTYSPPASTSGTKGSGGGGGRKKKKRGRR